MRRAPWWVGLLPLLLGAAMMALFLLAPAVYERFLFHKPRRETQAIELATFAVALAAGVSLLFTARRQGRNAGGLAFAVVGLAALFFAGEEINWGQTFYHWGVPQSEMHARHGPMTLHNIEGSPVKVQALGNLFVFACFVLSPLAWRFRRALRLPESLRPAVPEAACAVAAITALVWEHDVAAGPLRGVLVAWLGEVDHARVLAQLDEQKELMVATTLFLYALLRSRAARAPGGADA